MKRNQDNSTRNYQRWIAWFLSMVMCVSMLPVSAFAEQEVQDTIVATDEASPSIAEDMAAEADALALAQVEEDAAQQVQNHPLIPEQIEEQIDLPNTVYGTEDNAAVVLTSEDGISEIASEIVVTDTTPSDEQQADQTVGTDIQIVVEQPAETPETGIENIPGAAGNDDALQAQIEEQADAQEAKITEQEEDLPLSAVIEEAALPGDDGISSGELLDAYAERELENAIPRRRKLMAPKVTGERLDEGPRFAYYQLRELIAQVAAGEVTSTEITIDLSSLNLTYYPGDFGYDKFTADNIQTAVSKAGTKFGFGVKPQDTVLNALLADCSYELYWFDKTATTSVKFGTEGYPSYQTLTYVTYKLPVVEECRGGGTYLVNPSYARSIQSAVQNAQNIAAGVSGLSDYEKLRSFVQQICSMTSYNKTAANTNMAYGNPWQLIWVFDGDISTNVVCEGYAKAFRYLCDLCSFTSSAVSCFTVTGDLSGSFSTGGHMWNIVTMDDGQNYLVDVTNCDAGMIGAPDMLFLKKFTSGSVTDGYLFNINGDKITYTYDSEATGTYAASELTLWELDYGEACTHKRTKTVQENTVAATCIAEGSYEEVTLCDICGEELVRTTKSISKTAHTAGSKTKENEVAPTFTKTGSYEEVTHCSVCGEEVSRRTVSVAKLKQLATPSLPTLSLTTNGVKVRWTAVSGAKNYRVFHKTGNGSWQGLGNTTALTWIDTAVKSGTTYTYTIRCVSEDGKEYASGYNSTGRKITYITAPVLGTASNVNGGVKITWSQSAGAAKYRVFRKTGNASWTKLGDITGTAWTDKTANSGTTYTYTVRCVSSDGKNYTSSYDRKGLIIQFIAAPILRSVENVNGGVRITWNKSIGAPKYRILRKTGNRNWERLGETTGTTYTDKTAKACTTYTYAVRCINVDGTEYISAYNTAGLSIKHIASPTLGKVTNVSNGIRITWSKSVGAAKYRVFRKTGNGSWTKLGDTTGTAWTDKNAKKGITYTYTVRCITSNGRSYTSGYNGTGLTIRKN